MNDVATVIFVAAKPDRIWKQIAGFSRYGEWNPFLISVEGQRALGERATLTFHLTTADGRSADRAIAARIIKWEDEHEIRWSHGGWIPGLMDVEHWIRIAPCKGGAKVHQGLSASGLLSRLFGSDYFVMFKAGFEAMNTALKAEVEHQETARAPVAAVANDNAGVTPRAPDDRRRAG